MAYAYDKAKYHDETIQELGLPEEHSCNHTTFFLSWLIKSNLMSDMFVEESQPQIDDLRNGKTTANRIYESWDCCLISDMLNDEGNAFAKAYFDFENGQYISDYVDNLQGSLLTEFHVEYTPENEKIIHAIIERRYQEWKV